MYKIYSTKGFIVDKKDHGSDNLSYLIFSEKFGFISAKAYSVRSEKSKMSNFLQSMNLCNLSLTKGKGGWVITGGNLIDSIYYNYGKEAASVFTKVLNLMYRLSIKEEAQARLFKTLEKSADFLSLNKENSQEYTSELDIFLHINLLDDFGYLNKNQIERGVGYNIVDSGFNFEMINKIKENKDFLTKKINESLLEIH